MRETFCNFNLSSNQIRKERRKGTQFENIVLVMCPNCGLGTKSLDYYISILSPLNKLLAKHNCNIVFVRGNNDNPSFFNEDKLQLSHIKFAKDYTVLKLKNYNCLCIGGSASLNKNWKKRQSAKLKRDFYWEDEMPYYDENMLNSILDEFYIACIITCPTTSFTNIGTNALSRQYNKWLDQDKSLSDAIIQERQIMDKIYCKFTEKNVRPYVWYCTKFEKSRVDTVNDILFVSLGANESASVGNMISTNFGINMDEMVPQNNTQRNKNKTLNGGWDIGWNISSRANAQVHAFGEIGGIEVDGDNAYPF
jgi:hypothetical protein